MSQNPSTGYGIPAATGATNPNANYGPSLTGGTPEQITRYIRAAQDRQLITPKGATRRRARRS